MVVVTCVQLLLGDIIDVMIGEGDIEDSEVRAALTKEFGLGLLDRIPATTYLAITGMILSMMIAMPLGTLTVLKSNTFIDNGVQVMAHRRISIPELWFAIIAILLFTLQLGCLTSSGYTGRGLRTYSKASSS